MAIGGAFPAHFNSPGKPGGSGITLPINIIRNDVSKIIGACDLGNCPIWATVKSLGAEVDDLPQLGPL